MKIPKWAHSILKESDLEKINKAVALAESATDGEIVPMIVRRSSVTGHVPLLMGLVMVILFSLLEIPLYRWATETVQWIVWIVLLLLFFPMLKFISGLDWIQRYCIPTLDRAFQVQRRAELEFYSHHLDHTRSSTGILIFVSLMEHRAVVLADKSIAEKLPENTWAEVVGLVIEGLRQKDAGQGLVNAIQKSGELLATHFPIKPGDTNELHNDLILRD